MADCLFCAIANKTIPATIVYEDELVIAFKDINPVTPVHVLLIPKKHIDSLATVALEDKELLGHMLLSVKKVAELLQIDQDGYRLVSNCGENGGQVVKHLHFHLLGGKKLGTKLS